MAPFFGASTIVWANTIGVVLVALSIGYWLGGRLGDSRPELRSLCKMVLAASVLLAIVPLVAQPFFDVSVDALDEIEAGAFVGSLVGVLFLIAIPIADAGHLLAMGDPAGGPRRRARRAGSPAACTRSRPSDRCSGTLVSALLLIPFIGHPADLPRLRRSRSRWSRQRGWAGASRRCRWRWRPRSRSRSAP